MLACLVAALVGVQSGELELSATMGPITASTKVKLGVYTLEDVSGKGALRVAADDVTLDFQGGTLQSSRALTGRLETYNGIGIGIEGHKRITIRNAHIHGYQYNIRVLRSSGIRLENCEVGESRSQKILDGENVNQIWLDVRGLESWRTYGAGVWIEKSSKCVVTGVRAYQSQNGLILVHSNDNRVVGCDFSYNSGWGIALCSSSDNLICWNHADFVNRPWGEGWGADSAGMILTTGSNHNTCAYNSLTHSGDGFFLAAKNGGFDDKGKLQTAGSCDRNQVVYNDGSWSTANAFESTFSSDNVFFRNFANESNYGFWLGYSKRTLVEANEINGSHEDAVAHEQGAANSFLNNEIENTGGTAIHLWSGSDKRFSQAPSTSNIVFGNKIFRARHAFDFSNSSHLLVYNNIVRGAPTPADVHESASHLEIQPYAVEELHEIQALKPAGFKMYRESDFPKGWRWLSATAYGMRDYRKMTVPWKMSDPRTVRILMPPKGTAWSLEVPLWMVQSQTEYSREVTVSPKPSVLSTGWVRPFRIVAKSGTATPSVIEGQVIDVRWRVRWFKWFRADASAYGDSQGWATLFSGPPLKQETMSSLPVIVGYRAPEPGLPKDHYALDAFTDIQLGAGRYRFSTISDDGIQVLVDGKMVVSNWTHHGATGDTGELDLESGIHHIEVRYCQEDGGAALAMHWSMLP